MSLWDVLFPKRCVGCDTPGSFLCPVCFVGVRPAVDCICTVCNRPSFDGLTHPACRGRYTLDGVWCGLGYRGVVRKALKRIKYPPYHAAIVPQFVNLMVDSLEQQEVWAKIRTTLKSPVLHPIPLSQVRLRKRGYNQAELIAREVARAWHIPTATSLMIRTETQPLHAKGRDERRDALRGCFRVVADVPEEIILIDDILTSGATLNEASAVLKRAGARRVYALCLSRDQHE